MNIEQRKIADLIPYARNSRTHSDAQIAQIADNKLALQAGWDNEQTDQPTEAE